MRLEGGICDQPHPSLTFGKRLIRKAGVPPDATINRKNTTLAHWMSLRHDTKATSMSAWRRSA